MNLGHTHHTDVESFGKVDTFLRIIQAVCESCEDEDAESRSWENAEVWMCTHHRHEGP